MKNAGYVYNSNTGIYSKGMDWQFRLNNGKLEHRHLNKFGQGDWEIMSAKQKLF